MKRFFLFLLIGLGTSLFFEFIANTVGDGTLFRNENWFVFFLVWYGFWQSITYLFLRKKPLWMIAIVWAILGTVLEIVVFHRSNLLIDPIIYAMLFTLPIWLYRSLPRRSL